MPLRSYSFLWRVDYRITGNRMDIINHSSDSSSSDVVPAFPVHGTEGAGFLPCLSYSHISIIDSSDSPNSALPNLVTLSGSRKKSAWILSESVRLVASQYGLACCGFLTLTFRDHVTCPKEAQRRLNSLISNVINDRYLTYVGVFERQKSGRIHYHFLVALRDDIRSGFDFAAIANQDYRSANAALRAEWAFLRKAAPAYGFGRTELLPIRSSTEAIAKYVGKYIAKNIDARRDDQDKGVRLVRYARNARAGTCHFQFYRSARDWRRKVAMFAALVQAHHPDTIISGIADLSRVVGPRWAHNNREFISTL